MERFYNCTTGKFKTNFLVKEEMDRNIPWDRTKKVAGLLFAFAVVVAAINSGSASDILQKNHGSIGNNKIDEHLGELVKTQGSKVKIPVIIIFKDQPAYGVSSKVKKEFNNLFEEITKPAKGIYCRIKPEMTGKKSNNISELLTLESSLLTQQEKAVLKDTGEKLDSKTKEIKEYEIQEGENASGSTLSKARIPLLLIPAIATVIVVLKLMNIF